MTDPMVQRLRSFIDRRSYATNGNIVGWGVLLIAPDWLHGAPGGAAVLLGVVLLFRRPNHLETA